MANKTSRPLILIMQKQNLNKSTFHLLRKNFKILSKTHLLIVIDFSFFLIKKYKILKYEVYKMNNSLFIFTVVQEHYFVRL